MYRSAKLHCQLWKHQRFSTPSPEVRHRLPTTLSHVGLGKQDSISRPGGCWVCTGRPWMSCCGNCREHQVVRCSSSHTRSGTPKPGHEMQQQPHSLKDARSLSSSSSIAPDSWSAMRRCFTSAMVGRACGSCFQQSCSLRHTHAGRQFATGSTPGWQEER